jgi:DNA-binding XRE family transcriptional regulator
VKPYGKRSQILRALSERFPTRVVPRNVLHEMDAEFGVATKYCRRIAREAGFTLPKGREGRVRPCRECGQSSSIPDSVYCLDCQFLQLACEQCGKAFRRRRANVVGKARVFCGTACYAEGKRRGGPSEVAQRRLAAGLTQEDLAERLQVARTTVGAWERGDRRISDHWTVQLDAALGGRSAPGTPDTMSWDCCRSRPKIC